MNIADINEFRDKYSTSYKNDLFEIQKNGNAKKYSPRWEENDIESNMPKKTVFKQMLKYIPKTKTITKAIEIDNYEAPYSLE
jgi:recombinational DNA repair protein RecT